MCNGWAFLTDLHFFATSHFPTFFNSLHRMHFPRLRAQIPRRWTSTVAIPSLRHNVFSEKPPSLPANITDIALDTYPNPLFLMHTSDILRLKKHEYAHLLSIPYKNISETDRFCFSMIKVIVSDLLTQTDKISMLYTNIQDNEMRSIITETVRQKFKSDRVKASIFECIVDHTDKKFTQGVAKNIKYIIRRLEKSDEEKCVILLAYLERLAKANKEPNPVILLREKEWKQMLNVVPQHLLHKLFAYLLHVNIQPTNMKELSKLRRKLEKGSNIDKFVARTGHMDPKWHKMHDYQFNSEVKEKMVSFYPITDLFVFVKRAVDQNDIVAADFYLNLLVSKFEKTCFTQSTRPDQTSVSQDLQSLLDAIIGFIMKFKGAHHCTGVLRYMVQHDLKIGFNTLANVTRHLSEHGLFEEALVLVNNIDIKSLNQFQKTDLIRIIIGLIKAKYPDSPKILLGYVATFFSANNDECLQLLSELGLLQKIYNTKSGALDVVQKANVDENLTNFVVTTRVLNEMYDITLRSLSDLDHVAIEDLYKKYIEVASKPYDIFKKTRMDDQVVHILVKYLLKVNPTLQDMEISDSEIKFETAKNIVEDFHSKYPDLDAPKQTQYLYDLLISASLLVHNDYEFASRMISHSRNAGIPFSFNQIYPFIKYHYDRRQYDMAEKWYNELVKNGVKAQATPAKELFKMARDRQWFTSGFAYRKLLVHKNHKAREQMHRLQNDPVLFKNNFEDEITRQLINVTPDVNLTDELSSILQVNR